MRRSGSHPSTKEPTNSEPAGGSGARRSVPALTIVWHSDPERVGEICPLEELADGRPQELSRLEPRFGRPDAQSVRDLDDAHVSRSASIFLVPRDRGEIEVRPADSSRMVEVQGLPLTKSVTFSPAEIDGGIILLLGRRIVLCLHRIQVPVSRGPVMGMLGVSDEIERVRKLIRDVARTDVPVLIRGETGTGKELVARAVVEASRRADKPLVAVNMAAISISTAVAEMFGHERGAFTGAAAARRGYFGEASGGTLLLDELGVTPPELQRMLLRVLETGEYIPLGANRARPADVRIVAATDADLEADIASRSFSEPLYQRFAGFQIALAPLRRRREDIGLLLLDFLREELAAVHEGGRLDSRPSGRPWFSAAQAARFPLGDWPGNVRGLRNAVRQMVIP